MRQKFDASFQFQNFPYDSQNLTIGIESAFDLTTSHVLFHTKVRLRLYRGRRLGTHLPPCLTNPSTCSQPVIRAKEGVWHPLWDVTRISSVDDTTSLQNGGYGGPIQFEGFEQNDIERSRCGCHVRPLIRNA